MVTRSAISGFTQPDQEPGVVSGCKAGPAFALADDGLAARFDLDAGPDGVAIGADSLQAETDPVMGRRGIVAKQRRRHCPCG